MSDKIMTENFTDKILQDFARQRYKLFQDQNIEDGHFDVTFAFLDKDSSNLTSNSATNKEEKTEQNLSIDTSLLQKLHAHSFVLWPLSKVFEKTFYGPLATKNPILIERHSFEDFKEFLTFLYIADCEINGDNVMALVDLAEYYEIRPLMSKCAVFLSENITKSDNILKVYESLKIYSLEIPMAKILDFIAENTDAILKSEEFLVAKKEIIIDIVKMEKLSATEETLYKAVLKWARHQHKNPTNDVLKAELSDILPYIRFPIMSTKFLFEFVVPEGYLFPSLTDLSEILVDASAVEKNIVTERISKYSNKYRMSHGIPNSIKFKDGSGNMAYAIIQDEKIMKAIIKGCKGKESKGVKPYDIKLPPLNKRLRRAEPYVKYYAVRFHGRLAVMDLTDSFDWDHDYFGLRDQNVVVDEPEFFIEKEVIAAIILENNQFDFENGNIVVTVA